MTHRTGPVTAVLAALLVAGCAPEAASVAGGGAGSAPAATTAQPTRTGTPELRVSTVADGLSHVWDVGFLPDGRVLVTERDGRLALLSAATEGASVTPVAADFGDLLVRGEGGLMGLVVHPDFARVARVRAVMDFVVEVFRRDAGLWSGAARRNP